MPVMYSVENLVELAKEEFPDLNCYGFDVDPKGCTAYLSRNCVNDGHWSFEGDASTPALAMMDALNKLRAARKADK